MFLFIDISENSNRYNRLIYSDKNFLFTFEAKLSKLITHSQVKSKIMKSLSNLYLFIKCNKWERKLLHAKYLGLKVLMGSDTLRSKRSFQANDNVYQ